MLKARAGDVIILGLSDRNIELLKEGKPMLIELSELQLSGRVFIFHGSSEAAMQKTLEEEGLIGPDTHIAGRRLS